MPCEQYLDLISARLDAPLSEAEQIRLDDHLKTCGECRIIARQLQQMHSAFADIEVPAPAELSAGVMKTIRAEKAGRKRLIRQISGLAACLVLCAGLFGVTRWNDSAPMAQDAANGGEMFRYVADEDGDVVEEQVAKDADASVARYTSETESGAAAAGSALADSAVADICHHVASDQRQIVLACEAEPGAALITNVEQLAGFVAGLEADGLTDLLSDYDEEFFDENTLVVVIRQAPTAGYTYRMEGVTAHTLFLRETPPEAGDTVVTTTLILGQIQGINLPANPALNISRQ